MTSTVFSVQSLISVLSLLSLFPLIVGYSFDITAAPTQCGPLSLEITGGDSSPPYIAIVVPYSSPGTTEQQIPAFSHRFSNASTSFLLPYPADSSFVILIGDNNGLDTGSTSVPTTVGSSSNSSCLYTSPPPQFSFEYLSGSVPNQCQPTTLAWNSSAQGDVNIFLIIPGGQSSRIPTVNAGNLTGGLVGVPWVPNVRAGTGVLLLVGDSQGYGTGGITSFNIGDSPTQNTTCLDSQSPSSTAGTPAGAVQTDFSSQGVPGGSEGGGGGRSGNGGSGGSGGRGGRTSNHAGAIAGGVVGGIAACAIGGLLALCFVRRRRRRRRRHLLAHFIDLLPNDVQRDPDHPPEFYQPDPFIVPPSHADAETGSLRAGMERSSMSDVGHRYSTLTTAGASGTMSSVSGNLLAVGAGGVGTGKGGPESTQKSPANMPPPRPVNIVMHEDAGGLPEAGQASEVETIELPPSYNSVRR